MNERDGGIKLIVDDTKRGELPVGAGVKVAMWAMRDATIADFMSNVVR